MVQKTKNWNSNPLLRHPPEVLDLFVPPFWEQIIFDHSFGRLLVQALNGAIIIIF